MNKEILQTLLARSNGISLSGIDFQGETSLTKCDYHERYDGTHPTVDVGKATRDYWTAKASMDDSSPEAQEAKGELVKLIYAAQQKGEHSPEGKLLAALRLEQTNNYIRAMTNWLRWFDIVNLKNDEAPGVVNRTMNEVTIGYIGQHGAPKHMKMEKLSTHTAYPLYRISSPKIGYPTVDLIQGDISQMAKDAYDLQFDFNYNVDKVYKTLMDKSVATGGAFGTFTVTGAKPSRVYVAHSGIDTDNLPTTNAITVNEVAIDSAGAYNQGSVAGRFGIRCLEETIRYYNSWAGVFADGDPQPTGEILVPSVDAHAIMLDNTIIASSSNPDSLKQMENYFTQQVQKSGYGTIAYAGIVWKIIPTPVLASGTCYPIPAKKIGTAWFKPGLDESFTTTDREKHWEEFSQNKVLGGYISGQRRMNACKLTYK